MCGISGVISKNEINKDSFVKMNQIIKHRGPDDEGFVLFNNSHFEVLGSSDTASESWKSNELYSSKVDITISSFNGNIGLGHRRLSILDLSTKGHQPMCSDDERYWITYNGEVYNYLEIRKELIELGYIFNTDTDTEVILSAYQEWGVEFQQKLNGMWAFAIFDRLEKTIFLSRDRFGIKPLYYWFSPNGDFYFASEIKQFTVLAGWKALLNKERVLDYMYYSITDHTDETFFKGVYAVLPSHYLFDKINVITDLINNKLQLKKWYKPIQTNFNGSFAEAKETFLTKFQDAIKLHLRADVAVGSALSGGLDSSSIVSYVNVLLNEQNKSDLQKTFSSCSNDTRFDERIWMDKVVKETKVEGHFVYPKGEDVFILTEKILWHLDEPYQSQSAFLSNHVFKEAQKNKVKVLLNGQGADEYLSGYGAFQKFRYKYLLIKGNIVQLFIERISLKFIISILKESILDTLPFPVIKWLHRIQRKKHIMNRILTNKITSERYIHPYLTKRYKKNSLFNISDYQIFSDPLQKYLKWEDRNSMAHSVEARVPFLEMNLVEFSRSLPVEYLDELGKSKKVLVEAMKGILPETVRLRKDKKGFITPEEKWFLEDYFDEFVNMLKLNVKYSKGLICEKEAIRYFNEVKSGKAKFSYNYWRIIQLCIWMKIYNVNID